MEGWVHVLLVEFDRGRHRYESTWPPDTTPVTVKQREWNPVHMLGCYAT